jgi:hypothetical protein
MENVSRRKFISAIAGGFGLIGITYILLSYKKQRIVRPAISRIVRVSHPEATDGTGGKDNVNLNQIAINEMVEKGIKKLTKKDKIEKAWKEIIPNKNSKIAIKINCQITGIYTKAKVVKAVTDGLIFRGVSPSNIVIYDLTDNAFKIAGFEKNLGKGIKIGTNFELGGYSWKSWFGPPIYGIGRRFCKVLAGDGTFGCDYLINIPVLKALDGYSGVSISMKNHFGSISNCAKLHSTIQNSIGALNAHELIVKKTRLILVDAIFTEYKWVNGRDQKYVTITNQLMFGNDPAAIDKIGWKMIEKLRRHKGLKPVNPEPTFINKAVSNYGLGNDNLQRIDLLDT